MATMWYFFALVVFLGPIQGHPAVIEGEPAFMEDLRRVAEPGTRIVGGWEATDGQIPWQIGLRMISQAGGVSQCGGSLIHHLWVITAAHCAANRDNFVIRLGVTNQTRPEYIVEATRKYIHPNYDESRGGVQTDDIALIGLDDSIPYGVIQPVRLMNSQQRNIDFTGVVLTVSGFGLTDDSNKGGAVSEILRWTHLRGISNAVCRTWYPSSTVIQNETICAEFHENPAQSSCNGDSGGPLTFVDEDGESTMIGIVSFGSSVGCNSPFPSAYVRPGHYHEWYVEVTGINFDWSLEETNSTIYESKSGETDIIKIADLDQSIQAF